MANLVVFTELVGDRLPTHSTQIALAQARSISNALGATVYALAAVGPMSGQALDELAAELGKAGADRVMVWTRPLPLEPFHYAAHGHVLEAVTKRLRPRLFLFPMGMAAAQLAPVLAARIAADYFPQATPSFAAAALDEGKSGELRLHRTHASKRSFDVLDVMEADRMIVCTLADTADTTARGAGAAELEVLALSTPTARNIVARTGKLRIAVCVESTPSRAALRATQLASSMRDVQIVWIHAGAAKLETRLIPTVVYAVTSVVAIELERPHDSSLAMVLAAAVKQLECDLVFLGDRSDDQGMGLIGAAVAAQMDLPFVNQVVGIKEAEGGGIVALVAPDRFEFIVSLPAVLACDPNGGMPLDFDKDGNDTVLGLADLGIDPATMRKATSW
jgi:electron transfer flavoprotein alpha/beta subunit